ncbi:ABC-type cobalt transport system, permease component CbiQ and related transporter [Methanocella conradii HZ254]|uniref:ABC-type cobalt transport system, permease component CbiQ and related transporter n=1 Tax=Methanocella conradii (strain DSM 24694 / JCM 17849 / CGMCC 1.5162 / HZ254) TaxID=1041930 RepID=H8I7X8_METCZ|nr:energy-coupling factor transporter transmembrane component T [Methanocella conradii]AFD00378.1 ABC-type cobalt transport system, permease component CbiQ and related transporter [Methanocella conradii HZ254]
MSEVFQYIDRDTFIHRLNPLTKIVFCVVVILAGILCNDPHVLLFLLALPLAGLLISGMSRDVVQQAKMLSLVFAFLMVLTMLTVRSGEAYAFNGITLFTYDGLALGIIISLRLAAMFFAFMLLVNTTRPSDLVNTLVSRLYFPVDYALMLMITLRFIPTLQIEARKIRDAQAARGFNVRGIKNISKSIRPTITPLLSNSIGRAGSLGHIIELRGYHSGSKIKFTVIPLHGIDFVLIGLMLAGLAAYTIHALNFI